MTLHGSSWKLSFFVLSFLSSTCVPSFAEHYTYNPEIVDELDIDAVVPIVTEAHFDRLYVLFPVRGLRVFDLTDRERPVLLGSLPGSLPGVHEFRFRDMEVDGWTVYLAGHGTVETSEGPEAASVLIYDFRDPASPILLAHVEGSGARGIALQGHEFYLSLVPRGLASYIWYEGTDEPALHTLAPEPRAKGLAVEEPRLLVGEMDGLSIWELSLWRLGRVSLPGPAVRVGTDGEETAYVCTLWEGLRMVSFRDPYAPEEVSSFHSGFDWCWDVELENGAAFTVFSRNVDPLYILDVEDPSNPLVLAELALAEDTAALSLDIQQGYAYVSSRLDLPDSGELRPARLTTVRLNED